MNTTKMLEEGYSTKRPPLFNGSNYITWKKRMEHFIKAENYQAWRVIEIGDLEVTKKNEKGEVVPKLESEYEKDDYRKLEINALAVKLLYCGIGPRVFGLIMGCKNAKRIWDFLQVMYEGTSEMKKAKIDLLMKSFEHFEMTPKESVQDMLTRFSDIVDELALLDKVITPEEQKRKLYLSLPRDENWMANVLKVLESEDLKRFNMAWNNQLDRIISELHLKTRDVKGLKLSVLVVVALKSAEEFYSGIDDEFVLLLRKFRKSYQKISIGDQKEEESVKSSKCRLTKNWLSQMREYGLW